MQAEWIGNADVSHDAAVEKRTLALDGSIDNLVRYHEGPRGEFFAQATHCAKAEETCGAKLLECKNVRAIRDRRGGVDMAGSMPSQKKDVGFTYPRLAHRTAWRTKRRVKGEDLTSAGSLEIVDATSADDR